MKRPMLIVVIVASLLMTIAAWAAPQSDRRSFELTATSPPKPALKYQLLFDDLGDRLPGNSASLYRDAILLLSPDTGDKAQKALAAYDAKDFAKFDSIADTIGEAGVFDELDLAARREQCDWDVPFRERGAMTLLPHLRPLAHSITQLIKVRALRQIEQGKTDDALATLRLGYELSNKVGEEDVLISGLVSLHIQDEINDALAELMNRPDSPNLYWALAEYPSRAGILRKSMDGERLWFVTSLPNLTKSSSWHNLGFMAKAGEPLTAEQWRAIMDYVSNVMNPNGDNKTPPKHPVKDAGEQTIKDATQYFMQTHQVSADDTTKIDPMILLGEYYFHEYQVCFDEAYRLRGMPYPILIDQAQQAAADTKQLHRQQEANPFLPVFDFSNVAWTFGRADRQQAALMTVEAIRSYAAANEGKLPVTLDSITDTPAPNNPLTERPFEYKVENDVATLSDSQPDSPLVYTIKIRK